MIKGIEKNIIDLVSKGVCIKAMNAYKAEERGMAMILTVLRIILWLTYVPL